MIVQVRGASGSGKSTIVRQWCEEHGPPVRYMMAKAHNFGLGHIDCPRSRPFALAFPVPGRTAVVVPGHYESSGGGCDMIRKVRDIYDVVDQALFWKRNVLMEGLFVSKDVAATVDRYAPAGPVSPILRILYLDLPQEECYEAVQQRRAALGRELRPLRKHASDWGEVRRSVERLEMQGARVERHDRESCATRIRELLG